ncbi:hypothetical protein BDY21DRAFT_365140 [Lineolata rhizophorae]|uniref:Uncharacterized protein n=1 Tax=Lineolata rhizophorae TaxID=578093 RepID=A0A6A6NVW4_9PEZI|nr:hypothetical protein BDY21DRAFT_365140 [Lineolata rhizophorae]
MLEKLRRSSLLEFERLRQAQEADPTGDRRPTPRREMPRSSVALAATPPPPPSAAAAAAAAADESVMPRSMRDAAAVTAGATPGPTGDADGARGEGLWGGEVGVGVGAEAGAEAGADEDLGIVQPRPVSVAEAAARAAARAGAGAGGAEGKFFVEDFKGEGEQEEGQDAGPVFGEVRFEGGGGGGEERGEAAGAGPRKSEGSFSAEGELEGVVSPTER